VKDIKEKVEKLEREVFEIKVLDMEDAAFHTLGCIKGLRSVFLLYKAKEITEEDVRSAVKDLVVAVKCLQEAFHDLEDWMEKYMLRKKEASEE